MKLNVRFKKYIKDKIISNGIDINDLEIVKPLKENFGDFALPCFTIGIEN